MDNVYSSYMPKLKMANQALNLMGFYKIELAALEFEEVEEVDQIIQNHLLNGWIVEENIGIRIEGIDKMFWLQLTFHEGLLMEDIGANAFATMIENIQSDNLHFAHYSLERPYIFLFPASWQGKVGIHRKLHKKIEVGNRTKMAMTFATAAGDVPSAGGELTVTNISKFEIACNSKRRHR